jgi:hypothetical protein
VRTIALMPPLESFDLGVSGPRVGSDVHFSSFSLLGKLPCRTFGEFLEVPSEVNVQCFFCLVWDHFLASDEEISRTAGWQLSCKQRFSSFPFIESLPRKNR